MSLSFADTDPRSPRFRQTMIDMVSAILAKKTLQRLEGCLALMAREERLTEERQMIWDDFFRGQKNQKQYVKDYEAYQTEELKQNSLIDVARQGLSSDDFADYLKVEMASLQTQLDAMPAEEKAVTAEWGTHQEALADVFLNRELSVTLPDGDTLSLTETHKAALRPALKTPSPVDICKVIPEAASYHSGAIVAHSDLMRELKMVLSLASMRKKSRDDDRAIPPSEALRTLRQNKPFFAQLNQSIRSVVVQGASPVELVERAQGLCHAARASKERLALLGARLSVCEEANLSAQQGSYRPRG